MRRRVESAALVIALALGGCLQGCGDEYIELPPMADLQVRRLPEGEVEVEISPCYGGTVGAIVLRQDPIEESLWAADGGELGPDGFEVELRLPRFTLGRTPEGFQETHPLNPPLPPDEQLSITFVGEGTEAFLGAGMATFRYNELPSDFVPWDGVAG